MMQLASRLTSPSTRDVCNTSATYRTGPPPTHEGSINYLYQNPLQRTLLAFKEHHKTCAVRRKGAAAMEAHKESQRTDFLVKKYIETVRQQEQSTASVPIGLVNNNGVSSATTHHSINNSSSSHLNSSSSTNQHLSSSVCGNNSIPSTTTTTTSINSMKSDDGLGRTVPNSLSMCNNTQTNNRSSMKSPITDTPPKDLSIKSESLLNGSGISSCLHTQNNSVKPKHSGSNNMTRCSSAGIVRSSKLRPTSKDLIQRSLSLGHNTTPIMDDTENDLTLTPDEVYRLGTPLKPLEEETTMSSSVTPRITTPPTTSLSSGHGISRSIGSNSCSTSSSTITTPTSVTPPTLPLNQADNSSLLLELDAFSKVMNQVEQKEKAKERRASHVLDSAPHLMSPPPYSMSKSMFSSGGNMPRPLPGKQQYTTTSPHVHNCYNSSRVNVYQQQQPSVYNHQSNGGVCSNTPSIHSNQDTHYGISTSSGQSPHLQLQHLPIQAPPTSHSQLGALLQSPACSQSPSFEVAPPINYSFPNSNSSPVIPSHYPLWDSQAGGMGGVGGMSQSFEPPPSASQRAGQKRNLSSMYLPQTKVAHSTISHMAPPPVEQDIIQNFQNHSTNGVSSFPHGNSYSHIS